MRAIRTAVKGLGALAVLVAVMAVPAAATASPMYWAEYDGDPIDTVTVDVTGTIEVDLVNAGASGTADCQVTAEVELTNDWNNPTSPATQKVINLQPAGSVASSCTGWRNGCQLSHMTYSSPWTGTTAGYVSIFNNVQINMKWCDYFQASVAGTIDVAGTREIAIGEQELCTSGFGINDWLPSVGGYQATVTGELEFDLDTLEGLEDDDAGPCVVLFDY